MTSSHMVHWLYIMFVMFISSIIGMSFESIHEQRKVQVVYMGNIPEGEYLAHRHHVNLLQTLGHSKITVEKKTLINSYTRSFNGFAANLTSQEVSKLKSMKGVVSIFRSHQYQTQTTHSWDYIGLTLNVSRNIDVESDIIIGHLDRGVLPESKSFSDYGLSPIPKKWKGSCLGGKNFTCNKKLIGARFYDVNDLSGARDINGHGTHTASTAVGREVENTNFFGISNGTSRGGVPSTRLATYKVCTIHCESHNILAGFDDAISDNVDIITISVNNDLIQHISDSVISIGSFHAMVKGILTVNSVGNYGSSGFGGTDSIAPWIFTVGASADRTITNKLILGNGHTFMSPAVNAFELSNQKLVYGKTLTSHCDESLAEQCTADCIDPNLAKGNIIVCDTAESFSTEVFLTAEHVGASGVILREGEIYMYGPRVVPLPTAILNDTDFDYVKSYLKSKTVHSASLMKSEVIQNDVPIAAYFSSKGPNTIFPQIFKPDISAPGVNILAAYPSYVNPSEYQSNSKTFRTDYTFVTGSSMSCPHVAGAIAYVKSKHPDWTISAIKSSLMTTARNMNFEYNVDGELGHGAGYIDPVKAVNPGLVYETFIEDYFKMFCSLGSEGVKLIKMFKGGENCSKGHKISPKDLNYPAMTSGVRINSNFTITFLRTVTNVGYANSTYHAKIIDGDNMVHVDVNPNVLSFANLRERKSFSVTVSGRLLNHVHISPSLIWMDGTHTVRSPIVLYDSSII